MNFYGHGYILLVCGLQNANGLFAMDLPARNDSSTYLQSAMYGMGSVIHYFNLLLIVDTFRS